jgi:hypothetical protein
MQGIIAQNSAARADTSQTMKAINLVGRRVIKIYGGAAGLHA